MMTVRYCGRVGVSLFAVLVLAAVAVQAAPASLASPRVDAGSIEWRAEGEYGLVLTVSGPEGWHHRQEFAPGVAATFSVFDAKGEVRPAGSYVYELRAVPQVDEATRRQIAAVRESGRSGTGLRAAGKLPVELEAQTGAFLIDGGVIVMGGEVEAPGGGRPGSNPLATKDFVVADDLIVNGGSASICVGFDCVNGESFGSDTIRLKENNLRIHFEDTSVGAFPSTDWRIIANDSASGGQNKFSVEDSTAARTPFTIEGGATTNSVYVDSTGRIGFRTSTPVLDLHVATTNTPGMRLEQTNAGGFTAQTWDVAGNEANFFVRDVTSGSRLVFRLRPGAPTSSIDVAADGDVGFGTASPDSALHVLRSSASFVPGLNLQNAAGDVGFRLTNDVSLVDLNIIDDEFRINFGASPAELTLQADGDLIITGTYTPDYVFEPDYPLLSLPELKAFIEENGHLPNVPSDAEVKRTGRINLSEFQLRLLEKIEELTLYTLEQHDHIGSLRGELESKDARIADLQTRNSELESRQDGFVRQLETLQEAVAALQEER